MNLEEANKVGLTIFTTRDDKSTRHISLNGRETLCGKTPYEGVVLALPVNCDECRIQAGNKNREQEQGTEDHYSSVMNNDSHYQSWLFGGY